MISFKNLLEPEPVEAQSKPGDEADQLRLALALRGWVDPTMLLSPGLLPDERSRVMSAVAPDIQMASRDHPGLWFLRDEERQRLLTTTPADVLAGAMAPRGEYDTEDPVRQALELRRRSVPADLSAYRTEVVQALGSTFTWLDPGLHREHETADFWGREPDIERVKLRVAATLARRRRREDVDRMTAGTMHGRGPVLDELVNWATEPGQGPGRGRLRYLSGIGGVGKSTLFAHIEKRIGLLQGRRPLLAHIDCDRPGFDPTDPATLDLALFSQLAIASPAEAPELMGRAATLSRATRETDADYFVRTGQSGNRNRRLKPETQKSVQSYVKLESAVTQKSGERSSVSDNALSWLGGRTLVLLFDTTELMLARTAIGTNSEIAGTAEWFESLTGLMNGTDVRVLMAGRNAPDDKEVEALLRYVRTRTSWYVDDPGKLVDLTEAEAEALLIEAGVKDAAIARRAAQVLPRTPLILKIAADVYRADGPERQEFVDRMQRAAIDPTVARRYLTQRVVNHLASAAAKPHVLAAMVLPKVNEQLLRAVVLPASGIENPTMRQAGAVLQGLRDAGWLVREDPADRSLTFHPEVRRLVLDLMASDPDLERRLHKVRRAARDHHRGRRSSYDATLRIYYDLLLGEKPVGRSKFDMKLLGAAVEDLPARERGEASPAAASSGVSPVSAAEWKSFVEGTGQRDGEGDRLVKRGHADTALELYRRRPTQPLGQPPTFVVQALADEGYFTGSDVDVEAVVTAAAAELATHADGRRVPNWLRSRIYWLTRYALMARPGPLSPAHRALLKAMAGRTSGSGPVLLFPSITAVAEALAPGEGPIAPENWFSAHGAIESETRLFLVHYLRFGRRPQWKPHIDALLTLQEDWPEVAARGFSTSLERRFQNQLKTLRDTLFAANPRGTQVDFNRFVRQKLHTPVQIELALTTQRADAVRLLRGMTTEFHRPLRAAIIRYAQSSPGGNAKLIDLTADFLADLPLRTRELLDYEWRRRAERDVGAAFGLAIPFIDRSRRLPSFCEYLAEMAGKSRANGHLSVVVRRFLEWDKALSGGLNSDWSSLARREPG